MTAFEVENWTIDSKSTDPGVFTNAFTGSRKYRAVIKSPNFTIFTPKSPTE